MILIHATCVVIDGLGVLLRGRPGSGKSDLALRLMDEGAVLVADDYCEARVSAGRLVVSAPAAIAGRIEIRGIGIVTRPHLSAAPVALVADLGRDAEIPRVPDATVVTIEGVSLPWIVLDPFTASAAAKLRMMLSAGRAESRDAPLAAAAGLS